MITDIILFLPLVSSLLLFIIRKREFSIRLLNFNGVALLILSIVCLILFNRGHELESFGGYFIIDALNLLFLVVMCAVFCAVSFYSGAYIKRAGMHNKKTEYYSIGLLLFVFSMIGSVLSCNIGLSWVFIEATTLTSAYLIYFEKSKPALEATWKYVFICSIGISLGFVGMVILGVSTNNLNSLFLADLYTHFASFNQKWMNIGFVFFLIGIGTKAGLAPVHSWLPDAHSEAPSPVSALLSGVLLNTALLLILRYFHILNLAGCASYGRTIFMVMGTLSIFVTAVYVYTIKNYKRMLAYSSVENMGIISIGISLGEAGVIAALIHLFFHSLAKSSFFMTSGNIYLLYHSKQIDSVSNLKARDIRSAWLWILCFLAIAAIPPSPLFISEFLILKAMLAQRSYLLIVIFIILVTVILFGIGRVVIEMIFRTAKDQHDSEELSSVKLPLAMYLPQAILLVILGISGIYLLPFLSAMIQKASLLI